jgi:hypothetical protein
MADFDAQLPVRSTATEFTTEVANAAGTTINPAEDYAQGSTTSGENGVLAQGASTTAAPTYSTGTTNPLSLDTSGNLRVTVAGSGLQNVNVTEWNSISLGSPSSYGTSPGAVEVIGVNAFVTNPVAVTQSTSPWVVSLTSTTITGTVAVTQSTSPWVVAGSLTTNNAAPTSNNVGVLPAVASTAAPTYTTGDQVLLSTDLAGNLRVTATSVSLQNVNVTEWNTVALGSPSTYGTSPGAVNVIGVNSFITNTVTVAGNLTNNSAAPAATNIGVLSAVAAAAAPTWTTGDQVLLSENLSGFLRTTDSSDGSVSGGTAGTTSMLAGGIYNSTAPTLTTGQQASLQLTSSGALIVSTTGAGVTQTFTYVDNSAVASGSSVSQSVAGPINLDQIIVTASGEVKVVIAIGVTGSETTRIVGFTSAASKNFTYSFQDTYVIPTGSDVKVTITNRDVAAMDIYSTVVNH